MAAELEDALRRARDHAPFLRWAMEREPELLAGIDAAVDAPEAWIERPGIEAVGTRLRVERRRLALIVAIGDLARRYDLTRVTSLLTDFADRALDTAIRAAIVERTPDAEPAGFAAIALGKQGSGELNYSSDIDPIFLFDPDALPCRPREVPEEAAVRIGRRVIELLQTRDAEGYVLRVDLRLRPSPEVTPIALSINAAISHYESQAAPWERAAFIRARAAAGDRALGERFLDAIRPFVWRRSLDFGAIGEIRAISTRIRDHHVGQSVGPGYDLKRGRGGIREIEFFAQIHQLIHGGRDPRLRAPATRDALARLAEADLVDAEDAATLEAAYVLLRTIEHRAQMVDDRQTHLVPADSAALDNLARLHGMQHGEALLGRLRPATEAVGRIYDGIEAEQETSLARDPDALVANLARAGLEAPDNAARLIGRWRAGTYPALRSAPAQSALEAVLPGLVAALTGASDPDRAFARLDTLLSRLPSAVNFLRLLEAQPPLAELLGAILSHAPTLAEALGRRVEMLDALIDTSALDPIGDVTAIAAMMRRGERDDDYERLLDRVRRIVAEKRFALGTQIIAGTSDPLSVSHGYSSLAEAAVEVLAEATVAEFEAAHGRVRGSELAILALGRLGGGALTHASDLDLIFLFTGDHAAESDGAKPLGAVTYYNRLAQRVIGALSVATASGPLYEIDTRLRPSGNQGPIAVSLDGFARYQRESAWTWEHMALTRARPIFGSDAARAAIRAVIDDVLCGTRPERDIVADALSMRSEMAAHKPPVGPIDPKLAPGGLVDLEFAVHAQQLVHRTGFEPALDRAIETLAAKGLLSARLREAHDFLTRLLVVMRLVAPDGGLPAPATQPLVARALGAKDWDAVVATFAATLQEVSASWAAVGGR